MSDEEEVQKTKVLFIDDERKFTDMVKKNLDKTGEFEVLVENKGKNGLTAAQEFRPDIIFMDVLIPDMRGPEIAALIKDDRRLTATPIVFLTATVQRGQTEAFGGIVGGHPFTIKPAISKPVNTKDLIKCIRENLVSEEAGE